MVHLVFRRLVLVGENLEKVNGRYEECREALKGKGLRISKRKIKHTVLF